jgi:hypothetical protein
MPWDNKHNVTTGVSIGVRSTTRFSHLGINRFVRDLLWCEGMCPLGLKMEEP